MLLRLDDMDEEAGETEHAVEAYGRLIELWRDADTELLPHLEHTRQRIRSLGAVGETGTS